MGFQFTADRESSIRSVRNPRIDVWGWHWQCGAKNDDVSLGREPASVLERCMDDFTGRLAGMTAAVVSDAADHYYRQRRHIARRSIPLLKTRSACNYYYYYNYH